MPGAPKQPQPLLHQDPILSRQIHDIPHSCKCSEHEEIPENHFLRIRQAAPQLLHQLPCHRRSAQFFVRIGTVRLSGIDDDIRLRHGFLKLMMIRHYDRHAHLSGGCNLCRRCNTVVAGDDGIHARLLRPTDQVHIQPVTVLLPVRNIRIHICPGLLKAFQENISGADAVDIIISNDSYGHILPYLFSQKRHRLRNPFHQRSRMKIGRTAMEVFSNLFFTHNILVADQPCRKRGDMKSLTDCLKVCSLSNLHPFCHAQSLPHACKWN